MRHWALWMGTLAVINTLPRPARCQTSAQIQKERALGEGIAKDIERQAVRINDPSIIDYLQRIEDRLALAAGVKPLEVRLTRNPMLSALVLPTGVLYISGGLLERIASEAELAGLLAHEMAHGPWQTFSPKQVVGDNPFVRAALRTILAGHVGAHRMDQGAARTRTTSYRHSPENSLGRRLRPGGPSGASLQAFL